MIRWALRALGLALLWLLCVALWVASSPFEAPEERADAAIVLGAAVIKDAPSPVFAARLDHAIALYKAGRVKALILTGGQSPDDTISEAAAGRAYVLARGVLHSAVKIEEVSRTTHQNLVQAQRLVEQNEISSVLIVSDPLHVTRGVMMTRSLGMKAGGSGAPGTRYRSWSTWLPLLLRETYFVHHFWILGE